MPCDLSSLKELRRVVDFSLLSFFFVVRIDTMISKSSTCQTGNHYLLFLRSKLRPGHLAASMLRWVNNCTGFLVALKRTEVLLVWKKVPSFPFQIDDPPPVIHHTS